MTSSTSAIDYKKEYKRATGRYCFASIGVLVFSIVYEYFSHHIISYYMIFAFLWPLITGGMVNMLLSFTPFMVSRKTMPVQLHNMAVLTLTLGSLIRGAFEIYGTGNRLVFVYYYAGGILFVLSANCYVISYIRKR